MNVVTGQDMISARFARTAAEFLREGDMQRAIELCVEGSRTYPDYAMGHVMLGRCYEAFGRIQEALAEYRRALGTLPDNPTVIALVKRAEEKEQAEFQRFVAEQEKRFKETPKSGPPEPSVEDAPAPTTDPTIEHLMKELERRRREKHRAVSTGTEAPPPPVDRNAAIVTPTTAEIFASQQLYDDALKIYRELAGVSPGKYDARIRELERLAAEKAGRNNKAP
jgi:tetratricopeptide (TPR) repeat protein